MKTLNIDLPILRGRQLFATGFLDSEVTEKIAEELHASA